MNEYAPRSWKEFDSRWSRASSFQKFIIASVAFHILVIFGWVIPNRMAEARKQELVKKQEKLQAKREQEMKEEVAKVREEMREQEKDELAETQLKEFYDELVKDALEKEEAEKKWEEMKEELSEELAELAKVMEDDKADVLAAEEKVEEIKEKLVDELYDNLNADAQKDFKESYLDTAKQMAEKMKEEMKKKLTNNVAKPLTRNTENAFKEEVDRVKRDISQAKKNLQNLRKKFTAASRKLTEEAKSIEKEDVVIKHQEKVRSEAKIEELEKVAAKLEQARKKAAETAEDIDKAKAEIKAEVAKMDKVAVEKGELEKKKETVDATKPEAKKELYRIEKQQRQLEKSLAQSEKKLEKTRNKLESGQKKLEEVKQDLASAADMVKEKFKPEATNLKKMAESARKVADEVRAVTEEVKAENKELAKAEDKLTSKPVREIELKINKSIVAVRQEMAKAKTDVAISKQREHNARANVENINRASENEVRLIADMEKSLHEAANKVAELAPKTKEEILKVKEDHVSEAKFKVEKSSEAVKKKEVTKAVEERKEAAEKLLAARQKTEKALDNLNKLDPEKIVRERLRKLAANMEREEMRPDFEKRFEKEYMEKEMPKVVERIEQQFQEDVKKLDITPPKISIKKELEEILGKEFVEKVEAGKTSTEKLVKDKNLDKETGKPQDEAIEKNVAKKMRDKAKELADGAITRTVAEVAKKMDVNSDKMMADSGNLDSKVALLDRLGNMKNQLAKGRKDMLGTANQAGLMAARRRMRQRNTFLDQQGGDGQGLENRYSYMMRDRKAYLAMIEKMKDRVNKTGEVMDRVGAKGDALKDVVSTMSEPEYVLASAKIAEDKTDDSKRELKKPAFKVNRFMGAPYTNHPIRIDGDISEWKDVGSRSERLTWLYTSDDAKARFQSAYNNDGFYFMVEAEVDVNNGINDSVPLNSFWTGDCVEVFIDANNTKFRRRGEAHMRQFFVFPLGHSSERNIGGYESVFDSKGKWAGTFEKFPIGVFPRAGRKTKTGWIVEFMIPRSLFSGQQLEPGRIIGFTISCCMGGDNYAYWAHTKGLQPSTNPHSWGDIQFLGSDAEIVIGREGEKGEDGKPVQSMTLVPGKPLEVTVRDGDMNLDSRVKDKVQVAVAAASGSYVDVVLEETSASSGIFTGKVATRPNIGVSVPNVLDVYEGEVVKVTYIDQARAYGERNVRIEKETRAQSGGELFVSK